MSDKTLTPICFDSFNLQPGLLKGLEEAGFIRCTPIQALTLPLTLSGKDVAGQAQTGTGKTAAFLVALYNRLLTKPANLDRQANDPRAVILVPTRELAIQIDKDARQIGGYTGLKLALIYGGVDYDKQRKLLEDGVDIIVATPGRLIDFVRQHAVNFRAVEIMVMDEADRMFDLGFIKDIRFLLRRMPSASDRQNLLFSATLSHRVLELAYEHMNQPEKIVVETDSVTVARVRQSVYFPATEEKLPLLLGILSRMATIRGMVFVNTKIGCERVARALERNAYRVGVLSGDVPQRKREILLNRFVKGELNLLVATDVAARGLHIPNVTHVFNYDLPFDAEDYVHRIGRTARLGAEGDAISFACDEYAIGLPDIETYIGMKIPVVQLDPSMLIALPRESALTAGAENQQENTVEETLVEAAAERRKRRERDQRSGKRQEGKPASANSRRSGLDHGNNKAAMQTSSGGKHRSQRNPNGQPSRTAPPVINAENHPSIGLDAPEGQQKRRRRSRSERHGSKAESILNSTGEQLTTSETKLPLLTRIKLKLKSWAQRLPLPRGRR